MVGFNLNYSNSSLNLDLISQVQVKDLTYFYKISQFEH